LDIGVLGYIGIL